MKAPYASSTAMADSTSTSSIRPRSAAASHPRTAPTAAPPNATSRNSPAAGATANVPPTAATAIRSAVSAVPSLTRLSPSRIAASRSGAPAERMTDVVATGSVGASAAPTTKPAAHGTPAATCSTAAIAAMVASTSPTARKPIARRFERTSSAAKRNADG